MSVQNRSILFLNLYVLSLFIPFLLLHRSQYFSETALNMSKRFNDIHILRRLAAIFTIAIVGSTNLMDMLLCASAIESNTINDTSTAIPLATAFPSMQTALPSSSYFASTVCIQYPSYFSNYAILILIATSIVVQLTHVCKFILMLIIAGKTNKHTKHSIHCVPPFNWIIRIEFNCLRSTNEWAFWFNKTIDCVICIDYFDFRHGTAIIPTNTQYFIDINVYIPRRSTLLHEYIPIGSAF